MRLILFLLFTLFSVEVLAGTGSSINGTWVADIEATERSILQSAPRQDAKEIARSFLAVGPYLAITMLVVEDDSDMFSIYGDTSKKGKTFKLVSQDQAERRYIATIRIPPRANS